MPPLNLDLLRAENDAEWQRTWDELGLWNLACGMVRAFFVERRSPARPQFVEDVALEAMAELVDAVREGRVNHTRGIRGILETPRWDLTKSLEQTVKEIVEAWQNRK